MERAESFHRTNLIYTHQCMYQWALLITFKAPACINTGEHTYFPTSVSVVIDCVCVLTICVILLPVLHDSALHLLQEKDETRLMSFNAVVFKRSCKEAVPESATATLVF